MFQDTFFVVTHQQEFLRAQAALRRQVPAQPNLPTRIASVVRNAWTTITTPVESASTLTPTLSDYPYRS